MKTQNPKQNPLNDLLKVHALQTARGVGARIGIASASILLLLILTLIWFESFRYFSPNAKHMGVYFLLAAAMTSVLGITIYYWLLKRQKLNMTKEEELARRIGEDLPDVGDKLLNVVQLSHSQAPTGISTNLHQAAIQTGLRIAHKVPADILFPKTSIQRYLTRGGVAGLILVLFYLFNLQEMNGAIDRLSRMNTRFEYPLPTTLEIGSEKQIYLAGDTLKIEGELKGRPSERVQVVIQSKKDTLIYEMDVEEQRFDLLLENVMSTFTAIAKIHNDRPWEPWDAIQSESLEIQVINRPIVQDLKLRIRPPRYTRLPLEVHTRDILDISGFRGSVVRIEGLSSKELSSVNLQFESGKTLAADLDENRFQAEFRLDQPDKLWFTLEDDEGVQNLDPLRYPIHVAIDADPLIRVVVPAHDVIIGENQLIPTRVKMDDDFGFSRLELNYELIHPDYLMPDTTTYSVRIPLTDPGLASQEVDFLWDVSGISLMPEDALQYWFSVWDNNTVDGPSSAVSRKWIARLPSLDEMFSEISEGNEQIQKEQEEVLEIVKDIKEKVDELAMEVQKEPELDWTQQQEAESAIEQVEALKEQLEEISQQLDEMVSSAEDQNLFSEETLDKYSELQQMMQELITPELMEAMERLQQAIQENRPEQIEMAMEEFQSAMENFEESLERTLEIFKQVEIEQKLDEVAKRLNELADRQEDLAKDLDSMDSSDASQVEQKITEDFQQAEQAVDELAELLREHEEIPEELATDLQSEMESEQVEEKLENTMESLQAQRMEQAQRSADQAARSMKKLSQSASQMQSAAQQMMMEDVLSDFREILHATLRLSQAQEQLESQTTNVSGQSSLIRDYADGQMRLMDGLKQMAAQLQALGEKTFAVSQSMGKSAGAVQAHMTESIRQMEARNPRKASQAQLKARENLNRMALQISNSMNALEQSGESSGLSDYLQQLQSMSGQQQGLNQQTLMQMGMGNTQMMQELARRQLQLREALSQIEQGMGSDSRMLGDLGKIGEEMEAVAKELKKKRPSQRVHEQQERILSRLLDAQRSATQRDFSKKRKSETATTGRDWKSAASLPDDLGEARNVLYEELLYSLKQDYNREEKAMIRTYLNQLEAELNEDQ